MKILSLAVRMVFGREFVLYSVIGGVSTALDVMVYCLLNKIYGVHYQLANAISVATSLSNGFLWNYYCNFKVKDRFWLRLAGFYGVGMTGWLLSVVLLFLFIETLGVGTTVSKGISVVICTLFQFCMNKMFTFRRLSRWRQK